MFDEKSAAPRSSDKSHTQLQSLAHQLQEIFDALRLNADHLAGDLFHHDALFQVSEAVRLDEQLAAIIEELKSLSYVVAEK